MEVPEARLGEFYAGDAYVVRHVLCQGRRESITLYYWLGAKCTADESGAAALAAKRLDDEAGPAVRTFAYHHLLQRPKVVAPLLAAKTPFWNQYLLRLGFSRVEEIMRETMAINEKTAARSRDVIETLLGEITAIYRDGRFLAGDTFSRADLAAGALLSPLFMPSRYPVPWPRPQRLPPDLRAWNQRNEPLLSPMAEFYRTHR